MKKSNSSIIFKLTLLIILFSSCTYTTKIPLESPANLKVTNVTESSATISWDSVPNANDYEVYVIALSQESNNLIFFPESSKVEVTNLEWDEEYEVRVKARSTDTIWDKFTDGENAKTTFKTTMPKTTDGELAYPVNVKAIIKDEVITLTWDKVEGAVYYDIEYKYYNPIMPAPFKTKTITLEANKLSFIDQPTEEDKKQLHKITYAVRARNKDFSNKSGWSKKTVIQFNK